MHAVRLRYYLAGGCPPAAARTYPGCRDQRMPERVVPLVLPGCLYFALASKAWGGGMAFYDPDAAGEVPARGYLITAQQFADIAAQEMYRAPESTLNLTDVLTNGRAALGPGRYETLVSPGSFDEHPVLTFTAPWGSGDVQWTSPSGAYLQNLASGLREAHGWDVERAADYLSACPGAAGSWSAEEIISLQAAQAVVDEGPPERECPVPVSPRAARGKADDT